MIIKPSDSDKLIKLLTEGPLILYGMGDTGKHIAQWCDTHEIPYLWSDQDAGKLEKEARGKSIAPEKIATECPDANVVVSSLAYKNDIVKDLLNFGVDMERILSPILFIPEEVTWKDIESDESTNWPLMQKRWRLIWEWGWLPDALKSVADYGCGKQYIKRFLTDTCDYYPIDYIDRGGGTFVCDFNKREFPNIYAELSACVSVLMYIKPAEELLHHICEHTKQWVIFSFPPLEKLSDIEIRRHEGMFQNFTEFQIIELFEKEGYRLKDKKDGEGNFTYFMFEKQ